MQSNCLRSGSVLAQHKALPCCSISVPQQLRHPNGLSYSQHLSRPIPAASTQPHSHAPHRSSIRAAAAPAVLPVSVAAACFPALQSALAPALPYIMAAAAACCAALVALVSLTPKQHASRQQHIAIIEWHALLSSCQADLTQSPVSVASLCAQQMNADA